jgi:hypothetical protein
MLPDDFCVPIGSAAVAGLETDEDFRRAAERLLPAALEQYGRELGEEAWQHAPRLADAFGGGVPSDPARLARDRREMVEEYVRDARANARDREAILEHLVRRLKELKSRAATGPG